MLRIQCRKHRSLYWQTHPPTPLSWLMAKGFREQVATHHRNTDRHISSGLLFRYSISGTCSPTPAASRQSERSVACSGRLHDAQMLCLPPEVMKERTRREASVQRMADLRETITARRTTDGWYCRGSIALASVEMRPATISEITASVRTC